MEREINYPGIISRLNKNHVLERRGSINDADVNEIIGRPVAGQFYCCFIAAWEKKGQLEKSKLLFRLATTLMIKRF